MYLKEGWLKALVFFFLYLIVTGLFDNLGTISIYELIKTEHSSNLPKFVIVHNYILKPENLFFLLLSQSFQLLGLVLLLLLIKKVFHFNVLNWFKLNYNNYKNSIKSFFLGAITIFIIIIYLYLKGYVLFEKISFSLIRLTGYLLLFIIVAVIEETVFRGLILGNLKESINKYLALAVSSFLFVLIHLLNAGISLVSIMNLFLAGLIMGVLFILFDNLWMPIGFHLSWNFFQGPVFGFNISGLKINGILNPIYIDNSIKYTGGDFGLEGSFLTTIVSVFFLIAVFFYYKNHKIKNQFV
ncbi:MAG: CPBP family intramembrane metalloprotease [Bacteroidetes bacterium]|nr:CPBP family intramembrane metalloprotease [Bacteroidota bacterium]